MKQGGVSLIYAEARAMPRLIGLSTDRLILGRRCIKGAVGEYVGTRGQDGQG